jgi:hypothetical protein
MNLDELRTAWKEYDRKLESTQAIQDRIITSMIAERSANRFSGVKNQYRLGLAWMLVCLLFSVIIMATNPFDYRYIIQYIPMCIFAIGVSILLADMAKSYAAFRRILVTHYNVAEALKRIIAIYEQPKKLIRYTLIIFVFSQIVLLPLSFLPANVDRIGLWPAVLERLIPISIGALLFLLALKLGAFKQRHVDKFREDLSELQSLRKMSDELDSSE